MKPQFIKPRKRKKKMSPFKLFVLLLFLFTSLFIVFFEHIPIAHEYREKIEEVTGLDFEKVRQVREEVVVYAYAVSQEVTQYARSINDYTKDLLAKTPLAKSIEAQKENQEREKEQEQYLIAIQENMLQAHNQNLQNLQNMQQEEEIKARFSNGVHSDQAYGGFSDNLSDKNDDSSLEVTSFAGVTSPKNHEVADMQENQEQTVIIPLQDSQELRLVTIPLPELQELQEEKEKLVARKEIEESLGLTQDSKKTEQKLENIKQRQEELIADSLVNSSRTNSQ